MSKMMIKNMSLKVGQTLTLTGRPKSDATNFAVNVGPNEKDFAIHINPRFNAHGDENTVVCNSCQGGSWGEELREGGFPFQLGELFTLKITLTKAEFVIEYSDGSSIRFPNRFGEEKYLFFSFDGDVRIQGFDIK